MSKASRARRAADRESFVLRPFQGLTSECDLVAMREIVPAATAPLTLIDDYADRTVTAVTVLPLALPCLTRSDGSVLVALQTQVSAGDASRQVAAALIAALNIEAGATPTNVDITPDTPQLQALLDPTVPLEITVHDGFEFWVEHPDEMTDEVKASLEQANSAAPPTHRLSSVPAAYWSDEGERAWVRWVMPQEEYPLLNALARLHAGRVDDIGEGSRYVGSFRCHGLLAPVWEVPKGTPAEAFEAGAAAFSARLDEALANTDPLTAVERRSRDGLANRQLTIR
ncbi:DUF5926 family protein [Sporichthya sp.]|uniref:DUF5926 family protein n=1 Tax=Sporichthya sp. TaxID=65475 RepID=UPI0017E79F27|nr:DUF5926 family protein [Sporichthya sp.]MBA3745665.1 topoisomerase II [Sporichthya sp.]